MRWVRQYGSGKYGKLIRVEKADEVNEAARLRSQLRQAKEALADAHMELALEKAFLTWLIGSFPESFIACGANSTFYFSLCHRIANCNNSLESLRLNFSLMRAR